MRMRDGASFSLPIDFHDTSRRSQGDWTMGSGTPQRPPSGAHQGQPAPTPIAEREPQTAVAPLNTIAKEDIAAASKVVDEWLRSFTGGYVTLDRLTTVLGSIPIVGNVMALVDVFLDIVTILEKRSTDAVTRFLNWASLGINLIGLIPAPPTMAAARMSLRPTLHLVKQELMHGARNLGETIVTTLVGHLNASIVGELETFIDGAIARLSGILEDCARLSDSILDNLIGILQRVLGGQDLLTIAKPGAAETNDYDPKTQSTWSGMWRRAVKYSEGTAKRAANYAARKAAGYLPESVRVKVNEVIASLSTLKVDFRKQLTDLASQELEGSIMWLLRKLLAAIAQRKSLRAAIVSPGAGAEATKNRADTRVEHLRVQAPVNGDPGCKNCPVSGASVPSASKFAISLATGCESFTHVDFTLAAPLPITWARIYRSNLGAFDQGSLGARWLTPYSTRVDIATPAQGPRAGQLSLIYHGADGRSHAYPLLAVGQGHRDAIEEVTLTRLSETLLTVDFGKPVSAGEAGDWREVYELVNTVARKVSTQGRQNFRLVALHAGKEAVVGLRYDHVIAATGEQVLSDIISKQGGLTIAHVGTRPDAQSGLITSLWEIKGGQVVRQLAAYAHDAEGDLVSAQDENGGSWSYSYSHHLVTRYTDRTGRGMNLEYNGTGADAKAVREWSDDGSFALKLEWDRNIRLTYATDALGGETWYYYDILGYTYRIVHPDKRQEWFFRDEAKNITRHVHTDGSTDDFSYDADGNLRTHTRADGSQVHLAHDKRGRMTGLRDAEGGVWKRDYDADGNLVEEIDPLGHKTEYAYDKAGRPLRITDARGGVKTLAYTYAGQLASHTDCSGKTTRWEYDEQGRLVKATDAMGQSTRYRYTGANGQRQATTATNASHPGQLEEITLPDNTSEYFVHDAEGRLLAHTDALGRRTSYDYTRSGLVSERTDAAGHTLKYRWDLLGRLSELHNENGSRYDFRYDPVGRLLEETGFDRKITRYRHEESTGVLSEVVEGEHTTLLQFDPIGRLSERQAGGGAESFAYDRNGRLIEARNSDAKLQWFYDPAGNLTREHQHYVEGARTAVWQHRYDELNQRIATIRPDGHLTQWLTYGSGHVHGLLIDGQDILGFERDNLHREIAREQANGLIQKQNYDPAGRLLEQQISQTRRGALEPIGIRRSYQYDKVGQLIAIGDSRRGNLRYRYDPVGRLLEANSRLGRETFAFDPAGNIGDSSSDVEGGAQPAGRTTNRVAVRSGGDGRSMVGKLMDNLLKDYAGTHYQWDERGNLIERSRNGEKTVFTWDGYNRMRSAEAFGEITRFSYDPLGRRIAKRTRHACTLFGWDGDTLAFESTQSTEGRQEHVWRGDSVHYIHEPGSFVPLVQIRQARAVALSQTTDVKALMADNGGRYDIEQDPLWNGEQSQTPAPFVKEEIAFYQCDHLGTPQELTDHEGRVAWSASYKAWGEARQAISEAGRKAGFRNPIRFQGQYWDEETGLHYNRYRYYDPHSGRFISSDPIKILGGLNVFAYAKNSINHIDPLGLATTPATITASEITDKTRSEIRALAAAKGLTSTGQPDSSGLPRKWKCPCTGNQRLRLDRGHIDQQTGLPYNDPKAAVDHVHAYQPDGVTKIFSPVDGNAHFPTKGS
ncbi:MULTISPECIES: RHS repeat-associated core domain-containing protein [unclassified Variovorax]|uniref:RHS repeat-associated core domain-containing protein n=1 Tax=unclassified Variovorax TaxID=663243 RepID=UPI001F0B9158|nr:MULTISPECIES: RHS repeat-associated core domain-containing protein [unclassified Variovorax]